MKKNATSILHHMLHETVCLNVMHHGIQSIYKNVHWKHQKPEKGKIKSHHTSIKNKRNKKGWLDTRAPMTKCVNPHTRAGKSYLSEDRRHHLSQTMAAAVWRRTLSWAMVMITTPVVVMVAMELFCNRWGGVAMEGDQDRTGVRETNTRTGESS